jgi:hypothetical protein
VLAHSSHDTRRNATLPKCLEGRQADGGRWRGRWQLRPSQRMYDELMDIWRSGDFQFNFGAGNNNCSTADQLAYAITEQDLLVEYFLKREANRYVSLPAAGLWGERLRSVGRGISVCAGRWGESHGIRACSMMNCDGFERALSDIALLRSNQAGLMSWTGATTRATTLWTCDSAAGVRATTARASRYTTSRSCSR